jgi:2-dehydro-3-deoxygluconokinase
MILTFGEIMLRIAPPGMLRFRQALPGGCDLTFGGGESNVASSLAILGERVRYLTALPANPIADSALSQLDGLGVDTSCVLRREGRLGIYFLETGANQRGSNVVYDRAGSSIALAEAGEYDFDMALNGVTWVHVTGITPAISEAASRATLALVERAKRGGASVSCDLNFRKKLWKWRAGTEPRALAREIMAAVLPFVDVVIGNEEDASDVLGIEAEGTSVTAGEINAPAYETVAREIALQFPNIRQVAITLRESVSASHNNWGGMLYDRDQDRAFFAPLNAAGTYKPYEIRDIVDRVGGGDSFSAGLIAALVSEDYAAPDKAIAFAVAASCLKHSIKGDINYATRKDVVTLMGGDASGRVSR